MSESHAVKVEPTAVIKVEVCHDEMKALRDALACKTKQCECIESQKGKLTLEFIKLKWELNEKKDENECLCRERVLANKTIQDLKMQLDVFQSIALLKQLQEETQRTAETLASALAEERAAKRGRRA